MVVEYKNRYNDTFTFEELDNGNILWKGDFKYCRFGFPNNYDKAWKVFQEEYGGLSFEDFKKNVHAYDEEKEQYVFPELVPLITSNLNVVNMVDPSGGPYIAEDMDMGYIDEAFDGKIVKELQDREGGYEIVIQ